MNELQIMENKELRNKLAERYEVLDKVKNLITFSDTGLITTQKVAEYYEVNYDAIMKIWERNNDELKEDGALLLKGNEIKEKFALDIESISRLKGKFKYKNFEFTNGFNILLPRKAVLRIGMLLTESEVAENIRKELYKHDPELYFELSKSNQIRFKKYEKEIKNYLEFSFGENNVKYQVKLNKYSLDFVLYDKLHIEIDENGHTGYDKEKELERQLYINENTDYITIRHNPNKEMPFELIEKVIKYKDCFLENK